MNEIKIEELKMIQSIINRMANNSFILKGWAITLVSVLSTIMKGLNDTRSFFILMLPIIAFWILDAYFLRLERLYRKLYDYARRRSSEHTEDLFNMDVSRFEGEVDGLFKTMFWKPKGKRVPTLLAFYGGLILGLFLIFILS